MNLRNEGRQFGCIVSKNVLKHDYINIFGGNTKSLRLDALLTTLFVTSKPKSS